MKINLFLAAFFLSLLSQADVLNLKAEYSIPVTNPADFAINKFLISEYQIEVRSPVDATLTLTLPEDMVGRSDQKMTFKTTSILEDNTKILNGSSGTAVCKGKWIEAQCTFVFKKVKVNQNKLKEILDQKLSPEESQRQLQLVLRFSNDPIGVSKIISN
jgi:hypothetical protein